MAGEILESQAVKRSVSYYIMNNSSKIPDFSMLLTPPFIFGLDISLALMSAVGAIFNILVLWSIYHMEHRSQHYSFLAVLSSSDLVVSSIIIPSIILWDNKIIPTDGVYCTGTAVITLVILSTEIFIQVVIAGNRCALITWSGHRYKRVFGGHTVLLIIIFIVVLSFSFSLAPFFGFGEYGYNPQMGFCLLNPEVVTSRLLLLVGDICVILPSVVITFVAYIYIAIFVYRNHKIRARHSKSNSCIQKLAFNQRRLSSIVDRRRISRTTIESKRTRVVVLLLVIWLTFTLTWVPAVIFTLVDWHHDSQLLGFHRLVVSLALANSAFDPVILNVSDNQLRRELKRTLLSETDRQTL